jgi:hypothetical protein
LASRERELALISAAGDVHLENLNLRKDALRGLNLPVDIKGASSLHGEDAFIPFLSFLLFSR